MHTRCGRRRRLAGGQVGQHGVGELDQPLGLWVVGLEGGGDAEVEVGSRGFEFCQGDLPDLVEGLGDVLDHKRPGELADLVLSEEGAVIRADNVVEKGPASSGPLIGEKTDGTLGPDSVLQAGQLQSCEQRLAVDRVGGMACGWALDRDEPDELEL